MPYQIQITETLTVTQKGTTQIKRGDVVLFSTATAPSDGDRAAGVNAAKVAGVALHDSIGQGDQVLVLRRGRCPVKNTSGGALSQGARLVSHTDGGVQAATTTPHNIVGILLEDSADDDMSYADINPIIDVGP